MNETGQKVVIVTGGSQGIGAGLVDGYRQRRWAVVTNSLNIKPSKDPDVLTVKGDISEQATADKIISQALDRFGRVDTLINNAGVFVSKPFTDYTAEDYALVIGVNLAGFFWLTQRAIGQMLKQRSGHVVNISASIADRADSVEPTALTALTKGGLAAVTKSLAVEYASRGIRVNAVAPGIIQTPLQPAESYTPEALTGNCPRSAARAWSATSWGASCTSSQRRTSPERSCTSTAADSEPPDASRIGAAHGRLLRLCVARRGAVPDYMAPGQCRTGAGAADEHLAVGRDLQRVRGARDRLTSASRTRFGYRPGSPWARL